MSDEDEDSGPEVALGDAEAVAGAPVTRIASRLQWGMARSEVSRREGETEIRTPDGPRPLGEVLDEVDVPYFETRQEFIGAVRDVTGRGPIPTGEGTTNSHETEHTDNEENDTAGEETV